MNYICVLRLFSLFFAGKSTSPVIGEVVSLNKTVVAFSQTHVSLAAIAVVLSATAIAFIATCV